MCRSGEETARRFISMRKIFTLSLLLAATAASARQISPDEALSAANAFLNSKSLTPVEASGAMTRSDAQPYYVFNATDGNGFVIISGDDRFSKVLGYSDRGSFGFKNMPPQLKAMLDQFAENSAKPSNWNGTHSSWNNSFSATRADEGVLLKTANWGQDTPYNADCPNMGESNAPTGCVATAMAIVMKYHNWPETYNWDAMPMEITEENPAPNPELARLMKDAGEAVYMAYGANESGANMNWVGHKMQQVFKYSPDCQFITSQNFTSDKWLSLLKENVDAGNPVIYQGTNKELSMNHAFIVDGYNKEGYHVNWGWDGWFNGYYALDALTPNDAQDFSYNNGMVINMVPDKTGNQYSECFTDYGYFWISGGIGTCMNPSVENIKKGEPFHLINSLINLPKGFEGLIGLALVNKDGKIKEVLQSYNKSTYSSTDMEYLDMGSGSDFVNVIVSVDIDPTDRLQLVTKSNKDSDFKLVLGTLEWPSSIPVVDNKPEYGKVKIEIGENVHFEYSIGPYDNVNKQIMPGKTELTPLMGSSVYFSVYLENPEPDQLVALTLKGKKVIGLGNFAVESFNYVIGVSDDSELTAKAVKLSDNSLNLTAAGTLKDQLSPEEAVTVKNLTITGKMNAEDFWYIRDHCPSIQSLDISAVDIEAVKAADGEFSSMPIDNPANVIPQGALVSLSRLEVLILPDNLVGIADNSLMALNLKKISIPAGVEFIGLNALNGNTNLEAVAILNPTPFAINDCVLNNTPYKENGILFVPKGSAKLYSEVEDWKNFSRIVEGDMPDNVIADVVIESIKYHCLYDEAYVAGYEGEPKNVTLPATISVEGITFPIVRVNGYAFSDCESLESLTLSENIIEIGERSIFGCRNLKTVKLNKGLKKIGREAFYQDFKLEECDLPEGLEELGMCAFLNNNLKNVVIPKNAAPANDLKVFANCQSLEKFEVAEGNKHFKVIDGILYRITEKGLILESVPGLKTGDIVLPEECITVWESSMMLNSEKECNIIFNPQVELIEQEAVTSTGVKEIVLPNNAFVYPNAIFSVMSLETLVFTGALKSSEGMISTAPSLKNILIETSDNMVNLNGIFQDPYETINIFTSSTVKNFTYSDPCVVYVPGQCADGYKTKADNDVKEMWRYNINRKEGIFEIVPQIEGLAIDKVTINDKVVAPQDGIYKLDGASTQDIKVDYTLLGRQKMSTHYTSEFNATVADAKVSGVGEIINSDITAADVYSIDGMIMLRNASKEQINTLPNGIYIIREGNETRKIVVRN